jgi:hypothetical protein
MTTNRGSQRGAAGAAVAVLLLLALVVAPLVLHFAQKRHDRLPFDVDAAFPADRALVGGEAFASTVAALMDHELSGGSGWRPNDFVLWGPAVTADNNANRQLGIILAVRNSVRILRDHLTKVSSTEFDKNLMTAHTAFEHDPEKFWLPSAEYRFREGVAALERYIAGLEAVPPTSKPLRGRNVEVIRLFQAWTDLLGDAHASLFKDHEADGSAVRPWRTDDYFYRAQGVTHVLYHLSRAVQREYVDVWKDRPTVTELLDEVAEALGTAAMLKPLVVLDGDAAGLFANHRRNLDGYVVEARQKIYSIREELEK